MTQPIIKVLILDTSGIIYRHHHARRRTCLIGIRLDITFFGMQNFLDRLFGDQSIFIKITFWAMLAIGLNHQFLSSFMGANWP